ncbi:MAG: two-component regulator propeller domain-containing protein [Chitinophagaceae bacterium]
MTAQPGQRYVFSPLGSREGLADDDVRAGVQDKKGYIWIATMNGLQRYDGQRFFTLRHKNDDAKSVPNNKIYKLQLDQKERLWLHCGENKTGYLNVHDLSFHPVPVRLKDDLVKRSAVTLFNNNDGSVMLLFLKHSIQTYNEEADEFSDKYTPFSLPEKWLPNWLSQDKKNNYWVACDSGLVKFNSNTKKLSYRGHNEENDEMINAFGTILYASHPLYDNSGRFWFDSWSPSGAGPILYCYNNISKTTTTWETRVALTKTYHEIHNIQEQEDGSIWLVGMNLMAHLPKSAKNFELIPNNVAGEFTIRYDVIKMLFQDREKNIWVCTDKGLYRFNPPAQLFKVISNQREDDNEDHVNAQDITDILQTTSGDILVSTWGNGTFSYNNNLIPIKPGYTKPLSQGGEDLTWALLQRRNGDIWRVCQGGAIIITYAATKKTVKINPTIFQSTIRQVVEDNNGDIWLGTHQGELVKWTSATNTFQLINKSTTVNRLYKDRKGIIWVCTGSDGVYNVNPSSNKITAQYTISGAEGKRLMGLGASDIVQHNDSVYIIGSDCLNVLNIKTGDIHFFNDENGLPSNSVENIIEDKKGYVWVTTGNTLCSIKLEGFIISMFTEEDGLPPSSFSLASANLLNDGRIAIGRSHDFIVFDPENLSPGEIMLPKPEITAFALMNDWLSLDSLQKLREVELGYNQNSVTIEFSTLTYLNHFAVMYMMKNLDKNWIVAGGNKEAVYNYLPPGDYTFMIKCINGEGGSSAITELKISVRAPFWQTWWFYCFLALIVAALFYWIDRERSRRKESIQKMRGNIAGSLHEEVNIALNNINVLSEIARIKADKEPEQSKNYITEIHHKSHNMIIAMDDMLWSIDPANDSMSKTIDRIREFADALRNRYNVSIELQTDDKVIALKPDMIIRHELMMIYKLALRLLVEEFWAKETLIHLGYVKSQLQLNIFSLGVRLNDTNNNTIKAMQEMKAKATAIEATLEFQTDEKGTAIILAI